VDGPDPEIRYDHIRGVEGFSLIELLIGLVLMGIMVLALYEFFGGQDRTYRTQDDIAEMQQNLRVAVARISNDLTLVGYGAPHWSTINGTDASAWYNTAANWAPFRIDSSHSVIDIIGCLDPSRYTLDPAGATEGTNVITLAEAGAGDKFNTRTRRDICIGGIENARIAEAHGNRLSVDTGEPQGNALPLQMTQPSGSSVCLVTWRTYSVDVDGILRADDHRGSGRQPVANNIQGITIDVEMTGRPMFTISLTARTRRKNPATGDYIVSRVTNSVSVRN
jgi:prepilin-type N-terminal cleavage/methylation domain-containing protein